MNHHAIAAFKQTLAHATLALLSLSFHTHAKDFGRQGELFAIGEVDMLSWIDSRLHHLVRTGQTERLQQDMMEHVEQSAARPPRVEGLTTTTTPRTFYIDPSLKLAQDVTDANGTLLYPKGTVINPFDTRTWPESLPHVQFEYQHVVVFFDGDDRAQRRWARQFTADKPIKWVLTGGKIDELARELSAPIYFDQQGHYSQKFQIAHVPSVLSQAGTRWQVREVDVSSFADIAPLPPKGEPAQ